MTEPSLHHPGGTGGVDVPQIRRQFLSTALACVDLSANAAVGEAWQAPSVLRELNIGALVGHLTRGIEQVEWFLDGESHGAAPITAAEYLAPFTDTGDLSSERNRAVRARGAERAAVGQASIVRKTRACLRRLSARIVSEPEGRILEAQGSSGIRGRFLLLDEYLKVRLVDQVVHYEDLALSVPAAAAVALDPAAYSVAIDVLVEAASLRHGTAAVLRALTRRERDTVEALRVL